MREQIEKLLASDISAYRIAKDTGIAQSKISGLRSGSIKIENLTLAIAEKLVSYYEEETKMRNEIESLEKIIELKETLDRSERGFPSITIWKNKAEILKTLQTNGDEDVDWAAQVAEAYVDFEKDEKIIEVDLGNAWPEKFHAHEFWAINEYIK